ncbi:flavin oxidoreductase [Mycobacterium sp. CBMA293]|nr:flavin oxidoreductase [Mycolicibacterium sp. CBMA 360]MUL58872.1 flavin oxidoreductase [Mycolicibacterium sp. CBMA 335]MUL69266.1 flavin oxidoreductase [Mycolicibacterium sp. CBMA 311]MUL94230.1 flavin oxidoreductase [Mycolicibacterium sp. CBMA 230]MUM11359.1 flavin oxidoreductase [Mycolicibacterium sp. CBMA 293]MUM32428.1 flavin oxidoreductase [Mycolicibacterium sp. CBMA 361]
MTVDPWSPLRLKSGATLRNRFMLAPMTTNSSDPDGCVTREELQYLRRRGAAGFGAAVTSCAYVHEDGRSWQGIGASVDGHLESLRAVARAIGHSGSLSLLQLYDGGRIALPNLVGPQGIRGPSPIPSARPDARTPRELHSSEIDDLIAAFARAAVLGVQAGFGGIEIHGANHYLIHQFFSPRANQRNDGWGGEVAQRARFPLAVAEAVRSAVGPAVTLGFRVTPFESEAGGYTLDDSALLADRLAEAGVDYVHISMDDFRKNSPQPEDRDWTKSRDAVESRNPITAIAAAVAGRCAVVASGGIRALGDAREALDAGADLIAVGRAALIDPEWVDKMKAAPGQHVRTHLPANSNDIETALTIPGPMVQYLLSRPGWIPRLEGEN